jgi:hypothetical protein
MFRIRMFIVIVPKMFDDGVVVVGIFCVSDEMGPLSHVRWAASD